MAIIPQNPLFIQAGIYPNLHHLVGNLDENPAHLPEQTFVQTQAYKLFDAGLNVFPLPRGRKAGYPWKRLQYTRLNREDNAYGLTPLFAGDCNIAVMCGATSGNLFVIDCETHETFKSHLRELDHRHIPVWAVITARGGHIYFRCEEGEVENIEPGLLPDAELRGRHGYVLAPLSLHPSGKSYEWAMCEDTRPPLVSASQIDWLKDASGKSIQLQVIPNRLNRKMRWTQAMVSPFSALAKATKDYIASGHLTPEGSRNTRLFSAACDLAGNGYTYEEAENMLAPVAMMSGLLQPEVLLTLESAYSRSRTPSRPHTPAPAGQNSLWLRALLYASHRCWQGASGGNLRALFLALIERSRVASNENGVFRASLRELADMARLAVNTVRRLVNLLEQASLLHKVGSDRMSSASLWRFGDSVIKEGMRLEALPDAAVPEHWRAYAESLVYADSSERGSIGKSGMFLYRFMTTRPTPMMPSELAQHSGLTLNQVNYALLKLKRYGLIRRVLQGWLADNCTDEELGVITQTTGRGEARRQRHRQERELFAGKLLLRARMRSEGRAFIEALVQQARALRQAMQPRHGATDDAPALIS